MAIFFISIGTEIYPASLLLDNVGTILIFYLLFVCLKAGTVFLAYWVGNESARNGFLSATGLCAMGEFAFIISAEALSYSVADESFYTSVIGAALLSMITLPIMCRYTDRIWDKSVEKCPRKLYASCCSLNEARSRTYERISATSKKSQKAGSRRMPHAYVNGLEIAIIEIAFYFVLTPLSDWLADAFGGNVVLYQLLVLVLNFIALTVPTYYLINNVKFLDEMIISGAKMIANSGNGGKNPTAVYERFLNFLEINTYLVILGIDFLIILLVPNTIPLPWWYYLVILAIAAAVLLLLFIRNRRRKKEQAAEDFSDEESEEEASL